MMNKTEKIINTFKNHPRFPFLNWNTNYDDYCAMFLCLTNILKCYIPKEEYVNWSYAYGFEDFRRNPDGIVSYPVSCINSNLELVVFLGSIKLNEKGERETSFSVQINRDDRWDDRWERNVPTDEWYNEIAIKVDFNNPIALKKIDSIFNTILAKKMTFQELLPLAETNLNIDDE